MMTPEDDDDESHRNVASYRRVYSTGIPRSIYHPVSSPTNLGSTNNEY